jgi:cytochrome c biogenesis protein CcdA
MPSLDQITIPVILVTGLIDSINPCAIGVLIFLVSTLLALSHDRKRMLVVGSIYIAAVYVTYFIAGLGLIWFINRWNIIEEVGIAVGLLLVVLGFVELKDFFSRGQEFSLGIAPQYVARIKKIARHATIPGVIVLGFFVSAVELPCTGGPYLAITTYIAAVLKTVHFDTAQFTRAFIYLLLYNFIFVLPLLVILGLAYAGMSIKAIQRWKQTYRKWMRLAMGLLMIGLGILLILYAKGAISIGV